MRVESVGERQVEIGVERERERSRYESGECSRERE